MGHVAWGGGTGEASRGQTPAATSAERGDGAAAATSSTTSSINISPTDFFVGFFTLPRELQDNKIRLAEQLSGPYHDSSSSDASRLTEPAARNKHAAQAEVEAAAATAAESKQKLAPDQAREPRASLSSPSSSSCRLTASGLRWLLERRWLPDRRRAAAAHHRYPPRALSLASRASLRRFNAEMRRLRREAERLAASVIAARTAAAQARGDCSTADAIIRWIAAQHVVAGRGEHDLARAACIARFGWSPWKVVGRTAAEDGDDERRAAHRRHARRPTRRACYFKSWLGSFANLMRDY